MTKRTKITLAAASAFGLAALVATSVSAQAGGPGGTMGGPGGWFGKGMPELAAAADTDGDGRLSKAELYEFKKTRFATFDADKDGTLSATEFKAMIEDMKQRRLERMLSRLDSDGNGTVDVEEFARADMHKVMKPGHHGGKRGGWFSWFWN